jgi:hypothetical protein
MLPATVDRRSDISPTRTPGIAGQALVYEMTMIGAMLPHWPAPRRFSVRIASSIGEVV